MKNQSSFTSLLLLIAATVVVTMAGTASAQPPAFSANISISGAPEGAICLGDSVYLTVDWSTNKNVTRCQWYVNGVGQGESAIDASSGTSDFSFTPQAAGSYIVMFRIWHHNSNQADRDASEDVTITVQECQQCQWQPESAWAAGTRYVTQGNWATYTPYVADDTVTLYAGQTIEAGMVHFSSPDNDIVTITITLDSGWRFAEAVENVKVQDYMDPPAGNPSPGQFEWKGDADGSSFEIEVPVNSFYGVHVDVEHCVAAI